jgi:hypothetical protein
MTWVAAAIGGSALIGGIAGMSGAKKQKQAADQATLLQANMYQQGRTDQAPFIDMGQAAAKQLYGDVIGPNAPLTQRFGLDQFHESPSYQWQLQQGQQAIDKGANARGNYYAPQTLQDLGKFQQGLAGTDFNNAYNQYMAQNQQQFNMLSGMTGIGQNAAAGVGNAGMQSAAMQGQFLTGGAAAQAGGYMGAANALSGGAMGLAGYNQYLQGMNAPSYGGMQTVPDYNTMPLGKGF